MKKLRIQFILFISILIFLGNISLNAQNKGLRTITEKELRYHLSFLAASELRGRETPSVELEIATLYLANWAENAGLKPLNPDGSFYQKIPISVTSIAPAGTKIKLFKKNSLIVNKLNIDLKKRPRELSCDIYYEIASKYEELFE